MLAKRIIACLDVRDGQVVKGVRFRDHKTVGSILDLARYYQNEGADELVFYDIAASADGQRVSRNWISQVAEFLAIPFCVAGGIRSIEDAAEILSAGADKISINTPALENPNLITELSQRFGRQCVVVGVDSKKVENEYEVYSHTGRESSIRQTRWKTFAWIKEAESRGAGEIVLNCMDRDGTGTGYDIEQLRQAKSTVSIPLIASGGARIATDFETVFKKTGVDGALGAGAFHSRSLLIPNLKQNLSDLGIEMRI